MKKRILRILSSLLVVVMIVGSAPLSGFVGLDLPNLADLFTIKADAATAESGKCGANLIWTLDSNGTLNISGTGDMYNWRWDSEVPWYSYRSSIKTVVIGDSVTSIGDYAFYYCTSLTSVTIPDSVTSIGDYAFRSCTSLTSVTIPDSVTRIGNYAFWDCNSLTSVTIGDSVASIGDYAFYDCYSLTSVNITDISAWCGIAFDGVYANPLYYAEKLCLNNKLVTDLVIPNNVTSIGNYAFIYCACLRRVTIPDSVTSIGNSAFSHCTSLTSVTIGNGVTSIGWDAFGGCDSLTSVNITDISAWCGISFDGVAANPLYYAEKLYLNNKLVTDLVIPNNVTSIGSSAFSSCDSLTSVTIPDSVTSIGNGAFEYCNSLKSVTIPDRVTSIGDRAFWDCTSLTSVTIGNGVASIGDFAFLSCTSLTSVTIPDSVTSIGDYAFKYCDSLTSVTIGNSVTSIGEGAFYCCTSLTSVTIPDSVTSIGSSAFSYCTSLTSIIVDSNNRYYSGDSYGVLYNKDKTELIQYPIGNSRTSFTIPDSVTSIGDYAFYYCYRLTSVEIPDSVTSIGYRAFYDCDSLTDVYYTGTEDEWYGFSIGSGNDRLLNATIHYSFVPVSCVHSSYTDYTTPATCEVDGESYKLCNDCGEKFDVTVIPATGKHTYASTVTAVATCNATGTRKYTCTACGHSYTETIAKDSNNHTGGTEIRNAKNATCIADGYTGDTYCKGCSAVLQQGTTIPTLGHSYGEWATVTAPDCLDDGVDSRKCTRCNHEETRTVAALGHTAGEWEVVKEATVDETGEKVRKCVKCGAVLESAEIPQLKFDKVISEPSTTTLKYGDSIILHAEFEGTLPDGARIEWTADNDCFGMSVSEDGTTCEISPKSSGKTTFTVTVYDADENKIASSSQEMTSKAGFFNKFIAFFKKLFGLLKVIPYTI